MAYACTHILKIFYYNLCVGELFTSANAEKRWGYLRENYLKARKKFLDAQYIATKSGSAATTVVQPNFRYYQIMNFLNEPITYKT